MKVPKSIKRFVDIFSALPGIGPRQAIRLAFHFIRQGANYQSEVSKAIADLKKIGVCKRCFYIHESGSGPARQSPNGSSRMAGGLCDFCSDKNRNQSIIAIVEKETDIMSIENTGKFNGRYLVLGDLRKSGLLETDQKLRIKSLGGWIKKELGGKAEEIILAISPTIEGDVIAGILREQLKPLAEKVSRLGRGIPTGGEIEFADEDTLGSAIEMRS